MRRYAEFVVRARIPLAIAVTAILAIAAVTAPTIELDFTVFSLVDASDDAKAAIDEFYEYLPPRRIDCFLVAEWDEPIAKPEIEQLRRLTVGLESLPSVAGVTSLATALVIEMRFGLPVPRALTKIASDTPILEVVEGHDLVAGRLLSRDGRSAALLIARDETETGGMLETSERMAWIAELREAADALDLEGAPRLRFMAPAMVEDALIRHMRGDLGRSVTLQMLAFLLLLPLLFRTLRGTFLPIAVVVAAVVLHLAVLQWLGQSMSLIEVTIPGLILIIALCDAIHMLQRFEEGLGRGLSRTDAILDMTEHVGKACLYTSLTTAIGFLALLVIDNRVIRDFALSASLGVVIAFSCVVTLLPILLATAPIGARPGRMRRVGRLGYGRRALTWTAFAAVTAAGALGAARIDIGSRWLEELPDHEPIARDLMWYQEHFNGFLSVDVKLRGNLDSIEAFRAVRRLEDAVLEEPGVTGAESYVDWVREWIGNPDGELGSAQIVAGLATLKLSSAALSFPEHAVTRDFRLGRIRFQIADIGTGPVLDLIESIEDETEDFPSGLTAEVAGFDRVRLETSYGIVLTMLKSLIVSTVSIGIFLMIVYRSVGIGLLATIPNAFPILVALGVTGFAGIPLRIGIVMIYSLGVGLSVDNTIHLFSRFRDESRRHPERGVAGNLRRSLATTGHALIASSLVLVVGALCYLPSSFQSMSDVGILLSTMVVAALLAQIFLTPHLIEGCARWLRIAPPDAPGSTSPVPPPTTTGPGDGPSDPGSGATGPRDTGPASPRE